MSGALRQIQKMGYTIRAEDINADGLGWYIIEKDGIVVAEMNHYCTVEEALVHARKFAEDELKWLQKQEAV